MTQLSIRKLAPLLLCLFAHSSMGNAQDTPPTGPAQIMNRANAGRDQKDMQKAAAVGDKAAEAAPAPVAAAPVAAAPNPHAAAPADPFQPTADPASDLPKGTLQIDVVNAQGNPYASGEIVLGVMQSMGARTEERVTTDAQGRYVFRGLAVGSGQAYRVNVIAGGAKFSSNPFRLPDDSGFRVRIPMRPSTRDDKLIFAMLGQTVVELKDDRLHVTQQARVANAGDTVYVLPGDGMLVELPKGFTAFQWQEQMTDQRGTEVAGEGFRLKGSIPPGSFNLAWAFDVPRDGASARIPVTMPFRTYSYRVIAEAPEGLTLRVTDFPEAERVKDEGRNLMFTQLRRQPPEAPVGKLTIRIDGLPVPGPGRLIATALFAIAVAFGLLRAFSSDEDPAVIADRKRLLEERKAAVLAAAKQLETELARGEVGPQFHQKRIAELETELAMLLRDEATLSVRA